VPLDPDVTEAIARVFSGAEILGSKELAGGVSARAVVVEVRLLDGSEKRVVVRRPLGDRTVEPLVATEREFRLLSWCAEAGLPVPRPLGFDASQAAVLLEYVYGDLNFAPRDPLAMAEELATALARVHALGAPSAVRFLEPYRERAARSIAELPDAPDLELDEPRLRELLSRLWPWPQQNADTLLHGDYWPGNVLWRDDRLTAVLDWEEAAIGDPLADLSVARLDLLWAFGETVMDAFTESYRRQTRIDWQNLYRWDLYVALRPMGHLPRWASSYPSPPISRPDITVHSMRAGHQRFVARALDALAASGDA
jgi:aminoglycoside phosphotransferase (APT) family kinase protein